MPIMIVSGRSGDGDVAFGLNIGADDYVRKPFSVKELLARADALVRRAARKGPWAYQFGDCRLDIPSRKLMCNNRQVDLSPKEFALLEYFAEKTGRALTRDDILNAVWGYDSFSGPRTVDRFVTTLRSKIEPDPHNPIFIHTIREIGYKFEPPEPKP